MVSTAPALKKADAGIAVSGATDAARAAADIVLLAPGLSVIADAVRESRKIFERMYSYVVYRIAETIAILIFNFYPMTAIMIVLLALLNDGAILAIKWVRYLSRVVLVQYGVNRTTILNRRKADCISLLTFYFRAAVLECLLFLSYI